MIRMVGIAVVSVLSAYVLDKLGFGGTKLYLAFVCTVIFIGCMDGIRELLGAFGGITPPPLASEISVAALRVVGIGYIGGFFSDFCSELGARGAADGLLLFTRVEMLAVVMPYFLDILSLAGELLQ